jgi:hypothetical protein
MTQYVFIDSDGDKWELYNGQWWSVSYPGLSPRSMKSLQDEYGGEPYIVVENPDDIPELPELPAEPTELGHVYLSPRNGKYVRYAQPMTTDKPWVGTVSHEFYSWEDIHG